MGSFIDLPSRPSRKEDSSVLAKIPKKAAPVAKGAGNSLLDRISRIVSVVDKTLGGYSETYKCVTDAKYFESYIDKVIENGDVAIDTETNNSLDTTTCIIAGFSMYTPSMPPIYVPLNHISYVTMAPLNNMISMEFVTQQFQRLVDNAIKIIWFHASFDIGVIGNTLGVWLMDPYWDAYIAARKLNENEGDGHNNLKELYIKYCLDGKGDSFSFSGLFDGIDFRMIPLRAAYQYAAHDAYMTYMLYKYQEPYLTIGHPYCIEYNLEGVAKEFREIEMPVVNCVVDMEQEGFGLDLNYAEELRVKYRQKLQECEEHFHKLCAMYKDEINALKATSSVAIDDPILISSNKQIAFLLYDVLQLPVVDKENPRGTGEEIVSKLDHPICKALLEYRGVAKLLSTYIEKLPKVVSPATGKIHCKLNQVGADTGRFSCSDPNLQNIPSHNLEIRKMFIPPEGYVLLSSDYSAQEPRLTAHMSKDQQLIDAYVRGLDLYASIASAAFNFPYEECLEFRPDGTSNKDGKQRRSEAKSIVLGICYGRGIKSISEQLNCTTAKAQQVYDKVAKAYPGLIKFAEDSQQMARDLGYVTTVWGTKRRLPNINLDPFEFSVDRSEEAFDSNFNPLLDEFDEMEDEVSEEDKEYFINKLVKCYSKKRFNEIIKEAKSMGICLKDNRGLIAEAERQAVNARIQGSAAEQTKKAMILCRKNKRMQELKFKVILPVHDELLGICPREHAQECKVLFAQIMVEAAKDLSVPSKCDVEVTDRWYGESLF